MYAIMVWCFRIWYFFVCCSEWIEVYFRCRNIFESFYFIMLFVHLDFLLCSLRSHILLQNCFVHSCLTRLLLCLRAFSAQLAGRIFFRCFVMPSFVHIVLSCLDIFVVFLLSLIYNLELFVLLDVLLLSFRPNLFQRSSPVFSFSFLICVSSRISHPGFEFLFVFFRETPILSQTNFAPA